MRETRSRQASIHRGQEKKENTYKSFIGNTDVWRYNFTPWVFMVGKDITRFQKNKKEVSRKTEMKKGNLHSSVGNISGRFYIPANKVPTFRP